MADHAAVEHPGPEAPAAGTTLFLCGDVMTGRGIDQILPHPGDPTLFEPAVRSALGYVELAESRSGPIKRPVDFEYIWGDAPRIWSVQNPEARIINLETAVTAEGSPARGKSIHYRMHPANMGCLTAARISACVLANNHVLDWGEAGLVETLRVVAQTGIATAGAGRDQAEAAEPAVIGLADGRRVIIFAYGLGSSGIPPSWRAGPDRPGVNRLPDLSGHSAETVAHAVEAKRRTGDIVIVSLHWGANWDFEITRQERRFAHALIDLAEVSIVHGHSSHHVKGIEVYRGRLVLFGCGDFLNDYEGIGGYESFRGDLGLMYFPTVDPKSASLLRLTMIPTRMHGLQVRSGSKADRDWITRTLNRAGEDLGTRVTRAGDGSLSLEWN